MKNKGITLIALIITIIILLILAGITIGTLTQSGLFENSKIAKNEYEKAQEKEEQEIAKFSNQIENYNIQDIQDDKIQTDVNRYIVIGNYSSNVKKEIDIKEFTDNYQSISLNNFLIKNAKQKYQNQFLSEKYNNVLSSYDANNGILTLEQSSTNGEGYGFYFEYTVYLFIDKVPNIIQVGSYNSSTKKEIDMKEISSRYGELQLDNFYIKSITQRWKNGALTEKYNNILSSYDETTGILTLSQSSTNSSANGYGFYFDYEICAILDNIALFE